MLQITELAPALSRCGRAASGSALAVIAAMAACVEAMRLLLGG